MGSWGYAPMSNDTSEDIRDSFEEKLKYKKSFAAAIKEILVENKDILDDPDDVSNLWLALAERQWQYGFKNDEIKQKTEEICLYGKGQEIWKEEGVKEYTKRMKSLEKFYNKILTPKEKPKKIPKLIVRKPLFKVGDCIIKKLENGYYVAALVLNEDHSNIEYGSNLIGILDYYSKEKPTFEIYSRLPYLYLTNHKRDAISNYCNYGDRRLNIDVVGNINIADRKIEECRWFDFFKYFGSSVEEEFLKSDKK